MNKQMYIELLENYSSLLSTFLRHLKEEDENDINIDFEKFNMSKANIIQETNRKGNDIMTTDILGSVTKRKDGRWMGRYKNICVYSRISKLDCRKILNEKIKILLEQNRPTKDMTFYNWMQFWLENYKIDDVKESTATIYKGQLANLLKIDDAISKIKISKVDEYDIKKHLNILKTKTKGDAFIRFCTEAFSVARAKGLVKFDIMPLVKWKPIEEKNTIKKDALDFEQEREMLYSARRDYELSLLLTLALYTGMRCGEILGLTWDCIKEKHIIISKQYNLTTKKISVPKSQSSNRTIPLTIVASKIFEKLKEMNPNANATDSIWITPLPKLDARQRGFFRNKTYSIHSLRHTFGSRLYMLGFDVQLIKKWMGHNSTQITLDTYVHLYDEFKKGEFECPGMAFIDNNLCQAKTQM